MMEKTFDYHREPLKSIDGHANFYLTDLPYYDHRKKNETTDITMAYFFVRQLTIHSMICWSSQLG